MRRLISEIDRFREDLVNHRIKELNQNLKSLDELKIKIKELEDLINKNENS